MRILVAALTALTLALPVAAATDPTKAASAATAATAASAAPMDINRASLDDLKTLKGVGEVRAAAIVKGRPYARKDELVRKGVLPQAVYDEIRELIVARQ